MKIKHNKHYKPFFLWKVMESKEKEKAEKKEERDEKSKEQKEEKSESEKRIRKITKLYYSNPGVQEALLKFAKDREVVPRYFEGFGKRPDALQYLSDIINLVQKGATSFHSSEELWTNTLELSSEITKEQMDSLRKGWDLLIDIDSPYLDLSKIAAILVSIALEYYGIKNYGIKYSGSKGFHIIVSGKAFPSFFNGQETKKMFPEWPRAITEFLFHQIEDEFRIKAGKIMNLNKKGEKKRIYCLNCNRAALIGQLAIYECPVCRLTTRRKDVKQKERRLRCLNEKCPGVLELIETKDYYYCEYCKDFENEKNKLDSGKYPELFNERAGEEVSEHTKFDLVLVAPRHLFRMPYSLHEKTSLASAVLTKDEIQNFEPKDAEPLKIKIRDFMPKNISGEARRLLSAALEWKREHEKQEEETIKQKYKQYDNNIKIDLKEVNESVFPEPIKKLLKGIKDGKKRGLFVLITFYRSLGFPAEYINEKIRDWNKKNEVPLKEGYIQSQINWHLKQKKKILPPNYENQSFYRDLGLLDKKPEAKNPISEIMRKIRKR